MNTQLPTFVTRDLQNQQLKTQLQMSKHTFQKAVELCVDIKTKLSQEYIRKPIRGKLIQTVPTVIVDSQIIAQFIKDNDACLNIPDYLDAIVRLLQKVHNAILVDADHMTNTAVRQHLVDAYNAVLIEARAEIILNGLYQTDYFRLLPAHT